MMKALPEGHVCTRSVIRWHIGSLDLAGSLSEKANFTTGGATFFLYQLFVHQNGYLEWILDDRNVEEVIYEDLTEETGFPQGG